MITETYLNTKAREIYKQNCAVGWWDNPDRSAVGCCQLINTEICEATEGERKGLMDNKLKHRKMGEVELADALVRTLDLGAHLGLVYANFGTEDDMEEAYNMLSESSPADCHFFITIRLVQFGRDLNGVSYSVLIQSIIKCAEHFGYDIVGAMEEKIEFNKTRPDHQRNNRAKEGGKKF